MKVGEEESEEHHLLDGVACGAASVWPYLVWVVGNVRYG